MMKLSGVYLSAILAVVLGFVHSLSAATYSGGSGTAADPYQIANKGDLLTLAATTADYSKYFILVTDIDLAGEIFTAAVIAPDSTVSVSFQGTEFTGCFDGNGHSISNLHINTTSGYYIGLFGRINYGYVSNLGLVNVDITGYERVGGLCGENWGTINHSYATGAVTGSNYAGDLCGNNLGTINLCFARGTAEGNDYAGGLCGRNSGTITQSYAAVAVTESGSNVGGLCGYNYGTISQCYATGDVAGSNNVGGLCGYNRSIIVECYAAGAVIGESFVGGLLGYLYSGTVTDSFWDIQTSGQTTSAGGTGKTTGEMQTQSAFSDAGWDFSNTDGDISGWVLSGIEYPCLIWEITSVIPDVIGMTLQEAKVTLLSMEFPVGTISYAASDIIPVGQVMGLFPAAGTRISSGSMITLMVSGGPKYAGSGTAADPYRIATKYELLIMAATPADYSRHFILTANIDLTGETFTTAIIAPDTPEGSDFSGTKFTGIFNGNNHVVSNLTISTAKGNYIGLFGCVGSDGQISNLGLEGMAITGYAYIGGLCGYNYDGTINQCYAMGAVTGNNYVGGLCGENGWGTINHSYATGTVTGNRGHVGGLCGENFNSGTISQCYAISAVTGNDDYVGGLCGVNLGAVSQCYAKGMVMGTDDYVGGLCGDNDINGTTRQCYATGKVTGGRYVGGLCGYNYGTISQCYATGEVTGTSSCVGGLCGINGSYYSSGTIGQCYATGKVTGSAFVGGLCGWNDNYCTIKQCYATGTATGNSDVGGLCGYQQGDSAKIQNSFWDINTSGLTVGYNLSSSSPGVITNVVGKTTVQMKTRSTFISAGWDFSDNDGDAADWQMQVNDYPWLAWKQIDLPCNDDLFVDENADYIDFSIFSRWWLADCGSFNYWCCGADINQSGVVDLEDIIPWIEVVWLKRDPISDHVFNIAITNSWDYSSPDYSLDDRYVLYVEIETDDHVDHIDFVSPAGDTFTIPNTAITEHSISGGSLEVGREFDSETGRYYWCYAPRFNAPDFLAAYGDGLYTFTVYYSNGRSHQTSAWFGIPNTSDPVPQPIQTPVFTSFHYGDTLTSPVIFTWQPCTDPAAGSIEFDPQHVSGYEMEFQLPVSAAGLSSPLVMIPGYWEDIELSFERNYWSQNADGITILASKYSESDYEITVQ